VFSRRCLIREGLCQGRVKGSDACNSPIFARFILLFNYMCYMCLYVIKCLYVYSGLGLVDSMQRGNMVILDSGVFW